MNFRNTPYQKGAALIVSLMLLVVMTLLGINAVKTTTMEEKMAGNLRNKHLSFQSAEAAMRAAEMFIEGLAPDAVFSAAGTDGLYSQSAAGDTNFPIWEQDTPAINWQSIATDTGAVENAQFIIEDFGVAFRDASCALLTPLPPDCSLPVYRVSARGWGLNTQATTLIQSTYKQL